MSLAKIGLHMWHTTCMYHRRHQEQNRNELHFGFVGGQNKFDSSRATGQLIDTDKVS